jgi:hypothetical protein
MSISVLERMIELSKQLTPKDRGILINHLQEQIESEEAWETRVLREDLGDALNADGRIDFEKLDTIHVSFDELEAGLGGDA